MAALRAWRQRSQGLAGRRGRSVVDAVRGAGAIQAQDARASRLGVRARARVTEAEVIRAVDDERSVVRVQVPRGTIHMVPAEDARWMTALMGPEQVRRMGTRRAQLGLGDDLAERALEAIDAVLADRGPTARDALMEAVRDRGVAIAPAGQQHAHLVYLAMLTGRICRGPDRGSGATLVRMDDWLPAEPPRPAIAALRELALRHVAAYGPVGPRDLALWSGLPAAVARRGMELIGDRLVRVDSPLGELWALRHDPPPAGGRPPTRLLASFDGALLGHRDRSPILGGRALGEINAASWIRPTVLDGGRVVATWRPAVARGAVTVEVRPMDPAPAGLEARMRAEARDVGRFLGLPARLQIIPPA